MVGAHPMPGIPALVPSAAVQTTNASPAATQTVVVRPVKAAPAPILSAFVVQSSAEEGAPIPPLSPALAPPFSSAPAPSHSNLFLDVVGDAPAPAPALVRFLLLSLLLPPFPADSLQAVAFDVSAFRQIVAKLARASVLHNHTLKLKLEHEGKVLRFSSSLNPSFPYLRQAQKANQALWTFPVYQKRVAGEGYDGQLTETIYQYRMAQISEPAFTDMKSEFQFIHKLGSFPSSLLPLVLLIL